MANNHHVHNPEAENRIIEDVSKFGWHVALFEPTTYIPSFGYTIGLSKNYNHPEIITFALNIKIIHSMLNIAGEYIKNGGTISCYKDYPGYIKDFNVQFIDVAEDNLGDWFGYGIRFDGKNKFQAIQMIWPDKNNLYPWEDAFDARIKHFQPLLDRNTSFKFFEPKNRGIFTTRQVMHLDYPVLEVYHDKEDGSWQFLCGTTNDPGDLIVVCLEDIVKKDATLNQVFYLEPGESAHRKSVNDTWDIESGDD